VKLARKSGVPHVIRLRLTSGVQLDGFEYDMPLFNLTSERAAAIHCEKTVAKLPPDLDQDTEWIEVINKPDKTRGDWLDYFGLELAQQANADGYKVALFGLSRGEPEMDHWNTTIEHLTSGKQAVYARELPDGLNLLANSGDTDY
jgi:hypothetical protein